MTTGVKPEEAVEHLAGVLSKIDGTVLFATCVDEHGFVGDSECFVAKDKEVDEIPVEFVLDFPLKAEAPAAMLTSRVLGEFTAPTEELIRFTRSILDDAKIEGIELVDHYLVTDSGIISMRGTTELWN